MLESLLKEHGGELLSTLTGAGGLEQGQAEKLLPPALGGIGDALKSGQIDLGSLLGGDGGAVMGLLKQLNVGQIASSAGVSEEQAQGGLASLLPAVVSLLGDKSGGADGLLSMLGGSGGGASGALGALGGLAGKLFGK